MRASQPDPSSMRCARCRLRTCVCAHVPRVETRTRILIVRHAAERSKSSNTAHFARLALPGCELVEHGVDGAPLDGAGLPVGGAWLLYPDAGAPPPAGARPERLIVLDGTWSQARRMRQRLRALRGLPILSLPPPPPRLRMRTPGHPAGMSTLEAIARALALLEGDAVAAPLERLHDAVVRASVPPYGRELVGPVAERDPHA